MRILQLPPLRPIFLLEDWEIGKKQLLPTVPELPFAVFIDDQSRVHFEINHALRPLPTSFWKDLLFPMIRYRAMASHLIEQSFLNTQRRLIGGIQAIYRSGERQTAVIATGLLSFEKLQDVAIEVRKRALDVMVERLNDFNRWLGADYVHSGPTVIPDKVMRRVGWERYRIKKWKNRLGLYRESFPICLRKRVRVYWKKYRDVDIDY